MCIYGSSNQKVFIKIDILKILEEHIKIPEKEFFFGNVL